MSNLNSVTVLENAGNKGAFAYVEQVADSQHELFSQLKKSINGNNHAEKFIRCVISDFIYDTNDKYWYTENNFAEQAKQNWNGNYKEYAKDLAYSMEKAKTIINNIYLMYIANKQEINNVPIKEINDISTEFYFADEFKPYKNITDSRLGKLNVTELAEFNKIQDKINAVIKSNKL